MLGELPHLFDEGTKRSETEIGVGDHGRARGRGRRKDYNFRNPLGSSTAHSYVRIRRRGGGAFIKCDYTKESPSAHNSIRLVESDTPGASKHDWAVVLKVPRGWEAGSYHIAVLTPTPDGRLRYLRYAPLPAPPHGPRSRSRLQTRRSRSQHRPSSLESGA